jgi:hypothetical protein
VGIWYKYAVDPITSDSSLAIEWNVEAIDPPPGSGRFQLWIIRHPASSPSSFPWTEFRFNYDHTTSLIRSLPPGWWEAQVGAKALGQDVGPQSSSPMPNEDDTLYLLLTDPQTYPALQAITRLPTRTVGSVSYTPDWYAASTMPTSPSPYYHSHMPDSALQIKPLVTDVEIASIAPPNPFGGGVIADAGGPFVFPVSIRNVAYEPVFDVPVGIAVYQGNTLVTSTHEMVDTLRPRDTIEVDPHVDSLQPGLYRIVATVGASDDQNTANDVLSWQYVVRPGTDLMLFSIDEPVLGSHGTPRYAVGSPIDLTATIADVGTSSPSGMSYSYVVKSEDGTVEASGGQSTTTVPAPGTTAQVVLGTWTPSAPGRYYITARVACNHDEITGDNMLPSVPSFIWYAHSSALSDFEPLPAAVEIYLPDDPAAGDPAVQPFFPRPGSTVVGSSRVMATFINNGASDLSGPRAHVLITDPSGIDVYDNSITINTLPGADGMRSVSFPSFTGTAVGSYHATAWLEHGVTDTSRGNDTASWDFNVDTTGNGSKMALRAGTSVTCEVSPNPATDVVTVRWGTMTGAVELTVTDVLGRPVRAITREGRESSTLLDLSSCPAGVYLLRVESAAGESGVIPLVLR